MITLNLSDDVALDIMAQLGGQVGTILAKVGQPQPVVGSTINVAKAVRSAVAEMKSGTQFRNVDLQIKCNGPVSAVSNSLLKLREEGKLLMVRRGTWEVV